MTSRSAGSGFGLVLVVVGDFGATTGGLGFAAAPMDGGGFALAALVLDEAAGGVGAAMLGAAGGSVAGAVGSGGTAEGKPGPAACAEAPVGSSRASPTFDRQNISPAPTADPITSNMPRPSTTGSTVDCLRPTVASGEERVMAAAVLAITEPELEPMKSGLGVCAGVAPE
jgi:hypothetical protein